MVAALEVIGCVTKVFFALAVVYVRRNRARSFLQVLVKSAPAFLLQEVGDSISYWQTLA